MLGGNPVMIFAGYPAEMEDFLKLNPGFKRRIRSIFCFEDNTCEELAEVFKRKLEMHDFETAVLPEELSKVIAQKNTKEFRKEWNAGLCDRLFELSKENLDGRLKSNYFGVIADGCDLRTISREDINKAIDSIH